MNFEECNNRLKEIIKKLEDNEVSVEDATKLYEEGVTLMKNCYKILNESKGKVTILKNELEDMINSSTNED